VTKLVKYLYLLQLFTEDCMPRFSAQHGIRKKVLLSKTVITMISD